MKRYIVIFAALAALAAGPAFAQAPAANKAKPAKGGLGLGAPLRQRLLKNLDLTVSQKAQAKAILQEANQAAKPVRQQLQQNRQALEAAVKANNAGQIQQLATVAGGLQGQLVAIRSLGRARFFAILTPDQQTKLGDMTQKLKQILGKRAAG